MSIPVSSSPLAISAAEISVPISADEAISLAGFVGGVVADSLITVGRDRLLAGDSLREDFMTISDLATRLKRIAESPLVPVTVSSLKAARGKDSETLKSLFAADGPNLGDDLSESRANLQTFTNFGVPLKASLQTPVLVETIGPGKQTTTTFAWWSESQVANLSHPIVPNNDYPGTVTRQLEIKGTDGKVSQTIRYVVFDDYANLRTSLTDLASASSEINLIAADLGEQLGKDLA